MAEHGEFEILMKRNMEAIRVGMQHFEKARQEDSQRVEAMLGTVAQLTAEVQKLQQQVAVLRATAAGHGPTE